MSQVFFTIGRSAHADNNVNENNDIYLALDILLSEHRGCPTEVSFCCSVGFSVDFENDQVSVHVAKAYSVADGEGRFKRRSFDNYGSVPAFFSAFGVQENCCCF